MPGSADPLRWLTLALAAALTLPATASDAAAPAPPDAAAAILHPGDAVAAIVAHAPEATHFRFAAGVYRLLEIIPKDGDSFIGDPGAILSGAQIVSGFTREGGAYAAAINIAAPSTHGNCQPGRVCKQPNDVFLDGVRQEPVLASSAVGPGRFMIDYPARKLYLGSDPGGKTVELATSRYAFAGPGEEVSIAGFVIEKYANPAQSGAIGGWGRPVRWTIENCDIRDNHGAGLEIGPDTTVSHNLIRRNGQIGIAGGESNLVIEDNEIADNNQAGFDAGWEGGGVKLSRAIHALIKGNFVHGNHGAGIWDDGDDVDVTIEDNQVEDNDANGIQQEVSYEAVIRGNRVRGNGKRPHVWIWGSQILVQNSRNVAVRDNRVVVPDGGTGIILVEQRRELGPFGPHLVRDCTVAGNAIELAGESGIAAGIVTDYAASRVDRGGNRFDADTYRIPDVAGHYWAWPSWQGNIGFADFQHRYGQETSGTVALVGAR